MADTEVTRAEFEKFAIRNTYHLQAFEGFYASPYTQSAWESWQESSQQTAKAIAQKLRDRAQSERFEDWDAKNALNEVAHEIEREYEVK